MLALKTAGGLCGLSGYTRLACDEVLYQTRAPASQLHSASWASNPASSDAAVPEALRKSDERQAAEGS